MGCPADRRRFLTVSAWGQVALRVYAVRKPANACPKASNRGKYGTLKSDSDLSSVAPSLPADLLTEQVRTATVSLAYDRCARSLYRYFVVRVGGDAHLADDLMQQLWLQVLQATVPAIAAEAERWLFGVARNLVRTHWRRQRVRGSGTALDSDAVDSLAEKLVTADLAPAELENVELRERLMLALTRLPHADQELLVAYYFREVSHAAMAEAAGISIRAIEGRLYRARQALRDVLQIPED